MSFTRRSSLKVMGAASLVGWMSHADQLAAAGAATGPFQHGVASGDPLQNAVILWTRITPPEEPADLPVTWKISQDPDMRNIIRNGIEFATPTRDFTVKVDAVGLLPGTTYYYQFRFQGVDSPIGRTRTLPTSVKRLRIAVASCANMPYGYFNAYRAIANRGDLDCVIHLGDYIYEYAEGQYGSGKTLGRAPEPPNEIITLDDYRIRYAQYRSDPDLQEVHRLHPFIVVWDDHEIANDAWNGGANNHSDGEGSFQARKSSAVRAWNEWQPVRETPAVQMGHINRTFRFGDLVDLIMLDTRHYDRDQPVAANSPAIADPTRSLLGEEQEAWFYKQLTESRQSGRTWRLIGQQVMVGQLVGAQGIFNPDQWDGYLASRNRFLGHLATNGIGNVVVLTGDIHSSWGNDLALNPFNPAAYNPTTGTGSLAVEFVTPGITSPGIDDPIAAAGLRAQVLASHPHVKLLDLYRRGYMLLDITPEQVQAEWYHPVTIVTPNPTEVFGGALKVLNNAPRLVAATGPLQV